MNKKELVARVAQQTGMTKLNAEAAVSAVFEEIKKAMQQREAVQITGFGSFEVKHRPERTGHNPMTGDEITIKASNTPAFKAGKALKEAVNEN